jgi:cystine transport system permease protein
MKESRSPKRQRRARKTTSVVLLKACITFCVFALVAPALAAQDAPELRLAMSGAFQPFSTTNANNELVGFDADIARAVAERMEFTPELVQNPWESLPAGLDTGKYHLICGSQAITEKRLQTMHFSLPYYVSGAQVFVRGGVSELRALTVGVTANSTYAEYIEEHPDEFPECEVVQYGSEAEIIAALSTGKIDAYVSDRIVGGWYIKEGGEAGNIKPLGDLLYTEACGIAARMADDPDKDNRELIWKVNTALLSLVQDGTYARLYRNWVGADPDLEVLFAAWADHTKNIPPAQDVADRTEQAEDTGEFAKSLGSMLPLFFEAAWITLQLSALTAVFALFVGTLIGVGSAAGGPVTNKLAGAYILLVRGTPLLLQLFIAYYGVATVVNNATGGQWMGAWGAALLALVVNTGAYNAETIRGGILSVDRGQWEAAASLGMSRRKTLTRVILPQAFRNSVASLGNNGVVLIKDTSLVGAITLIELTYTSKNVVSQTGQPFLPFIVAAVFYLAIITLLDAGRKAWETRMMRSAGGRATA